MAVLQLKAGLTAKVPILTQQRKWIDGSLYDPKPGVERLIDHLERREANKQWLVELLSTLHAAGIVSDIFDPNAANKPVAQDKP